MRGRGRPRHPDILTPREWEVLSLLREGLSNERIADRLGVTLSTARFHVSEILGKLAVSSREEAAKWNPSDGREPGSRFGVILAMFRRASAPTLAAGTIAVAAVVVGLLIWGLLTGREVTPAGPRPMLAFSAGGSIYTLDSPDSAPHIVISGDRSASWAAAPAFSPDGKALLFSRGFDIWHATADGSNPHVLADVADLVTPPANSARTRHWALRM